MRLSHPLVHLSRPPSPPQASREASKENSPTERVKQMVILLDTVLSENADFMAELTQELREMEVGYRVTHGNMPPGSVRWRRRVIERDVDSSAKVGCSVSR